MKIVIKGDSNRKKIKMVGVSTDIIDSLTEDLGRVSAESKRPDVSIQDCVNHFSNNFEIVLRKYLDRKNNA